MATPKPILISSFKLNMRLFTWYLVWLTPMMLTCLLVLPRAKFRNKRTSRAFRWGHHNRPSITKLLSTNSTMYYVPRKQYILILSVTTTTNNKIPGTAIAFCIITATWSLLSSESLTNENTSLTLYSMQKSDHTKLTTRSSVYNYTTSISFWLMTDNEDVRKQLRGDFVFKTSGIIFLNN